jgi:hypothetical protein
MIKELTIVTAQGVKMYYIGQEIQGRLLSAIEVRPLLFTGDPFDHYCGFDDKGEMLFSVNCLAPCVVEYSTALVAKR